MKELTLHLTLDEANLTLEALGEQPYRRVYTLIAKLQGQASDQLNPREEQPAAVLPGAEEQS